MGQSISGSTSATKSQFLQYTEMMGIDREDIIDMYIKYGLQYNMRCDVAFALALIYTNFFLNTIENYNICGIGLQFGNDELEKFESYEECIITQYQILKRLSDKSYVCDSESLSYKRIDEPNIAYDAFNGFAGEITSIENLSKVWFNNTSAMRAASICETIWNTIQHINNFPNGPIIDLENQRGISFYVKLESKMSLNNAFNMKRQLTSLPFIKGQIPVRILMDEHSGLGWYNIYIGNFRNRGLAITCKNNLRVYGYYGSIGFKPNDFI